MNRKITLTIFNLILTTSLVLGQNYETISNYYYNQSTSTAEQVNGIRKAIEKNNLSSTARTYLSKIKELEELGKSTQKTFDKTGKSFQMATTNPNQSNACRQSERYYNLHESEVKRANKLSIAVNLAKSAYNLCIGNAFRTGNCDQQANNYDYQLRLYDQAVLDSKEFYDSYAFHNKECIRNVEEYNNAQRKYNNSMDNLDAEYKSKGKKLIKQIDQSWNQLVQAIQSSKQPYKEFFSNGKIKIESYVINNQFNGSYKKYFQNGKLKSEGDFVKGQQHGLWKQYNAEGFIIAEETIKENKRNGFCKYYYDGGILKTESNYIDDKKDGIHKGYFKNKKLALEENYLKGDLNGEYKIYFENGNIDVIGTYKNNLQDGQIQYFSKDRAGVLEIKGQYSNDLKTGDWFEYFPSGDLKAEYAYLKDKMHGEYTKYDESTGRIKVKTVFENGEEKRSKREYDLAPKISKQVIKQKELAANGDIEAHYVLGGWYEQGYVVEKDLEESFKWYLKAAEMGHVHSMNEVSMMYERGKGVRQNKEQQIYWSEKYATLGTPKGKYYLAKDYLGGSLYEDETSITKGIYWMEKAAELGNVESMYYLGEFYYSGEFNKPKDLKKAKAYFIQAAEKGNMLSQYNLAKMYQNGEAGDQDYGKALSWYKKSASQNSLVSDTDAPCEIGKMFLYGQGVEVNVDSAVYWFQNTTYTCGKIEMGKLLLANNRIDDALSIFEKLAYKGNAEGLYYFAMILYNQKVFRDAYTFFKQSSDKGFLQSRCMVGLMQLLGQGVTKDVNSGVKLINSAADEGDPLAQYYMGDLYFNGVGVSKDLVKAKEWMLKAEKNGMEQATQFIQMNLK